jgi:hypothetical protein
MLPLAVGLEVGGIDLELLGGDLEERGACLLRAAMMTALPTRWVVRLAKVPMSVRAAVGVAGVDEHRLERHAERLGADLGDHRAQALAEVDRRQRDHELARWVVAWTSAWDGSPPRFMPVG